MALDGRAPTTGEEAEPLVEIRGDVTRAHRRHARGRELDREWHSVKALADLGDGGCVRRIQREMAPPGDGAADEQPDPVRPEGFWGAARRDPPRPPPHPPPPPPPPAP